MEFIDWESFNSKKTDKFVKTAMKAIIALKKLKQLDPEMKIVLTITQRCNSNPHFIDPNPDEKTMTIWI